MQDGQENFSAELSQERIGLGEREMVLVHPVTSAPERVLYALDGNAALSMLKPDWLAARPGLALVLIGYAGASRFHLEHRSRDYTPPPPLDWDGGVRRALERPHGGAADFLAFLTQDLMPQAEARFGLVAPSRALWGHSYGGLFALWMLTRSGHGVSLLHAASPSLWWGDYALEQHLADNEPLAGGVRALDLSMGDSEVSRNGEVQTTPERLERLATRLEGRQGLRVHTQIFPGANHGDTFALSLAEAIARS